MLSVFDLLEKSWQVYKDKFGTLIGIAAVPVGASIVLVVLGMASVFVGSFALQEFSLQDPLSLFLTGVGALLAAAYLLFLVFWPAVALIYAVKEDTGFVKSFKLARPKLLPYIWVAFLSGLAVFAGFLLLVIPGIIFAVWFSLAYYVLVAEDKRGTKALARSKNLVQGHWWQVAGRMLFLTLLGAIVGGVLSVIPLIGPLVTNLLLTPFSTVFFYLLYRDLKQEQSQQQI